MFTVYRWYNVISCCSGYIVTAPNRLIPDRNESVCISLHNLKSSQDIDIVITLSTYVSYHRWGTPKAENKTLQVVKTTLQPASGGEYPYSTTYIMIFAGNIILRRK